MNSRTATFTVVSPALLYTWAFVDVVTRSYLPLRRVSRDELLPHSPLLTSSYMLPRDLRSRISPVSIPSSIHFPSPHYQQTAYAPLFSAIPVLRPRPRTRFVRRHLTHFRHIHNPTHLRSLFTESRHDSNFVQKNIPSNQITPRMRARTTHSLCQFRPEPRSHRCGPISGRSRTSEPRSARSVNIKVAPPMLGLVSCDRDLFDLLPAYSA